MENSPCPQDRADCTDLPGDFKCTCHNGYKQKDKTTCHGELLNYYMYFKWYALKNITL
jgi:hypothetical protein